jgi:hypothetical protein
MTRYLLPLLPGTLYAAFSGQLALFVIGFFGHKYEIAGVAALGRIGQVFLVLGSANVILVGPALARAPGNILLKRYAAVLGLAVVASSGILLFFTTFPGVIALLLGSQYGDLVRFVPLSIGASCLSYICGAMWSMHAARKWVFWWGGSAQIVTAVSIQVLSVKFLDLGTIAGVLKMNLYVAIGSVAVQVLHAIVGFSGNITRLIVKTRRVIGRSAVELIAWKH